jgi:hypothetical protein
MDEKPMHLRIERIANGGGARKKSIAEEDRASRRCAQRQQRPRRATPEIEHCRGQDCEDERRFEAARSTDQHHDKGKAQEPQKSEPTQLIFASLDSAMTRFLLSNASNINFCALSPYSELQARAAILLEATDWSSTPVTIGAVVQAARDQGVKLIKSLGWLATWFDLHLSNSMNTLRSITTKFFVE